MRLEILYLILKIKKKKERIGKCLIEIKEKNDKRQVKYQNKKTQLLYKIGMLSKKMFELEQLD